MNENNYILIVEDEEKVANFIKKGLQTQNITADIANSGKMALEMFAENKYNFVILDVGLPDMSGVEVCQKIRENNSNIPILMLTAMAGMGDKLAGFEAGTDDYLVKPFDFMELLVRIKALYKRCLEQTIETNSIENTLKVADLVLDLQEKVARRGEDLIRLTAKEFNLLEYLMRNKGIVISKIDIAEKVWDINFDTGTNFIEVYVNYLRNKIDKKFNNKLIHTIVGMGYMLKEK
jgi:two-component system copper resistance phosphate regulon response regulator CusR